MDFPQAVRKHDGRIAAFEPARLAHTLAAALQASGIAAPMAGVQAQALALQVGKVALKNGAAISSAALREVVLETFKESKLNQVAEAYAEWARNTTAFFLRLRVFEGTGFATQKGTEAERGGTWDRRRLTDSFVRAGLARDPACEAARAVERQLWLLYAASSFHTQEQQVLVGVVHALALQEISRRGLDARRYAAARIPARLQAQTPRFSPEISEECALPDAGPALEAFWLHGVHTPVVAAAAWNNELSLLPFPGSPAGWPRESPLDPLEVRPEDWCRALGGRGALSVRCDGPERAGALAKLLGYSAELRGAAEAERQRSNTAPRPGALKEIRLILNGSEHGTARDKGRAAPVTLNAGRFALQATARGRDEVSRRLAKVVEDAAQAHREREEYFGWSAPRGRELPVLVAGLWNAAARLRGLPFERPPFLAEVREEALLLAASLRGALTALRDGADLNLTLWSSAGLGGPDAAVRLWRADAEFLEKDGLRLSAEGAYPAGLELRAQLSFAGPHSHGGVGFGIAEPAHDTELEPARVLESADFSASGGADALTFLAAAAAHFDEPPALRLETPFSQEPEPSAWREFLQTLRDARIARARLVDGSSRRGFKILTRALRARTGGLPLFEEI